LLIREHLPASPYTKKVVFTSRFQRLFNPIPQKAEKINDFILEVVSG